MATGYVKNKQKLKGIRYMLFAIAAINAVIAVVFSVVSSFLENPLPMYLQSLITGLCAYIIPLFIYAKITGMTAQAAEEQFYLKKCKISHMIYALLLGVGWQFVMVVISIPMSLIFKGAADVAPITVTDLIAAIFVIGIMPAIFEEFLFRGIVDGSMSELNSRAAVIFSSVMFAVLHADIYNFVGYIIMGVIMTGLVRRTGTVYSAMIFHFANNITALLLGFFNSELVYTPILTITIFAVGVIGFAVVFAAFKSVTKKPEKVKAISTSTLLGQSFINIPILLCFVVLAAAMVIMSTY